MNANHSSDYFFGPLAEYLPNPNGPAERSLLHYIEHCGAKKMTMMKTSGLGLVKSRSAVLGCQLKESVLAPRVAKRTRGVQTMAIGNLLKPKSGKGAKDNGVGEKESESCLHGDLAKDIIRKARNIGALELAPADTYRGTAQSVREHLIDAFNKTQKFWKYVSSSSNQISGMFILICLFSNKYRGGMLLRTWHSSLGSI